MKEAKVRRISERAKWCGEPGSANINGKITRIICTKPAGHIGEHRWSWEPGPAEPLGSPPDSERVELCGAVTEHDGHKVVCEEAVGHEGQHCGSYKTPCTKNYWGGQFPEPKGVIRVITWPSPTPTAFDKAWEEHVVGKVFWGPGANDDSVVGRAKDSFEVGWQARGKADLEAMTGAVRKPRKERQLYIVDRFGHYVHAYGHNYEIEQAIKKLDTEQ